jgi:rubrerythrin
MAQKLDDPEIKEVFAILVNEEVLHKRTFEHMVSQIESYEPAENFPDEYFAYLRAYADNVIFDEQKLDEIIASINDKNSALDFAIRNEVASISYYLDVKKLVPETRRHQIDQIVDEERKHFIKLTDMKS